MIATDTTSGTRAVTVIELKRAWQAVQGGAFRDVLPVSRPHAGPTAPGPGWSRSESVLPVVGCLAQCGATTLALALATCAGGARLVECCTATASGLSAATTAELGTTGSGWITGRRDDVVVARRGAVHLSPLELPAPEPAADGTSLTVLDTGWEVGQLLATQGWLAQEVRSAAAVVAVSTATVPGVRRLEITLGLLDPDRTLVAVLGPDPRRWTRAVTGATGPATRDLIHRGRLLAVPPIKYLAEHGIDTAPLPAALLHAAQTVLRHTDVGAHTKGQP